MRMAEIVRVYGLNESLNISSYLCMNRQREAALKDLFCGEFPVTHRG